MRKIFTLTIAVLASFSLSAAVATLSLPSPVEESGNDVYTYSAASEIKLKSYEALWIEVPSASLSGNISVKASGSNNDRYLYIHKDNGATKDDTRKIAMSTSYQDFAFTSSDIKTDGGKYYLVFSTSDDYKMKNECAKLSVPAAAPTSPVSTIVISGQDVVFVGHKITLTATPDRKANAYYWQMDDVNIPGADAATYEFQPNAAGTFKFKAFARNDINPSGIFIESTEFVVTVNAINTRTDVTAATTWDFTKVSAKSEIKFTDTSDPSKSDTVLLANVPYVKNDADFNSQALEFSGEYVIRNSEYCQGKLWQFHSTVAGWIKVWFSNTGNNTARYVAVNGVVDETVSSANQTIVETPYIAVEAGDVKIEGSLETYNASAGQYLHVTKILFRTTDPTAIDNTEAEVKTVKTFENGQLIIIKNGVKYNATGAIVK